MRLDTIINGMTEIENGEIYACCVSGNRYSVHLLRIVKWKENPPSNNNDYMYGFIHEHGFSLFDYYGSVNYVPPHLSTGISLLTQDNEPISFSCTKSEYDNDNITIFMRGIPTASTNLERQPMFFDREGYFAHFDEARAFCLSQLIKQQQILTTAIAYYNDKEPDLALMAML